jgi:rare lipoprotein A
VVADSGTALPTAGRRAARARPAGAGARPGSWVGALGAILLLGSGCATTGTTPDALRPHSTIGLASFYGDAHHGRRTASGEAYDRNGLTAAHPALPFGTRLRVTNLENGRSVVVTVTDRGPFVSGRIVDVSYRAARELDFVREGITRVRLEALPTDPDRRATDPRAGR